MQYPVWLSKSKKFKWENVVTIYIYIKLEGHLDSFPFNPQYCFVLLISGCIEG